MKTEAKDQTIRISTDNIDLVLKTSPKGRLYQSYFGKRLMNDADFKHLSWNAVGAGWEVYPVSGTEDYFEPTLAVQHNDKNMTSVLYYQKHQQEFLSNGAIHTTIELADDQYPLSVKVHYMAFEKEDVIKTWTEISHKEKKPLTMSKYASGILYLNDYRYFLDEYSGDWASEVRKSSAELNYGKKIIDTKLGARAAMFAYPFFRVGLGAPVQENSGEVIVGTLGWTGNYQFTFEVDNLHNLRIISGINPYASTYELPAKEVFKTPEFIYTYSSEGAGKASRNLHDWARKYQLKDGMGDRLTLLNNWESTYFSFDQPKLASLMKEAKKLGVDLFLLDDGWFGNKYPRLSDNAGLGDWEPMQSKLADGIPGLVKAADEVGVKFGIWIEPEMVNPKSELYEKHPDWVIQLPNREVYYFRNQLVLDLSNPAVQNHVFGVVDNILKENPSIEYFKWDCNSPITNIYSPYLKEKQSHLYVEYVRGLYKVLDRIQAKYPKVMMMMCSGGGARCDYEGLKYFTEFWCSDNTDPVDRIYIQWNFSQIFPAKAMAAHVTSWNSTASIKFRTDVAMMCKLGFDINIDELPEYEQTFCANAVQVYNANKKTILDGDMYRLVSPHNNQHAAVMSVSKDKRNAVLFSYDIYPLFGSKVARVKLEGLDSSKLYRVEEVNLMPNKKSSLRENGGVFSGDYLMKVGINSLTTTRLNSRIISIKMQN